IIHEKKKTSSRPLAPRSLDIADLSAKFEQKVVAYGRKAWSASSDYPSMANQRQCFLLCPLNIDI
ncbi:hypothetical protein, partial [Algoriphagus litoralis]|uniref:hypothetical protein n=1 Tax=Algoriphagus litoralis TaxID=2202829 RepID=UPI0013007693